MGFEIATLRAGRVRAAMLSFGVGERAVWADWCGRGTALLDVAIFPASWALCECVDGKYFLHLAGLSVKVDVAHKPVGVLGVNDDDDGSGEFSHSVFGFGFEVSGGED